MTKVSTANWSMDGDVFKLLTNGEGQQSIWPFAQAIPVGWQRAGPVGSKQNCLDWIKTHWPDIAPRSLRNAPQ